MASFLILWLTSSLKNGWTTKKRGKGRRRKAFRRCMNPNGRKQQSTEHERLRRDGSSIQYGHSTTWQEAFQHDVAVVWGWRQYYVKNRLTFRIGPSSCQATISFEKTFPYQFAFTVHRSDRSCKLWRLQHVHREW